MIYVNVEELLSYLKEMADNYKRGGDDEEVIHQVLSSISDRIESTFICDASDFLKPCPHCGGTADILTITNDLIIAKCSSCGAQTKPLNKKNINGIASLWNMRTNE